MIQQYNRLAVALDDVGTGCNPPCERLAILATVWRCPGQHAKAGVVGHAPVTGEITTSPVGTVFVESILNNFGQQVGVFHRKTIVVCTLFCNPGTIFRGQVNGLPDLRQPFGSEFWQLANLIAAAKQFRQKIYHFFQETGFFFSRQLFILKISSKGSDQFPGCHLTAEH